MRSAQRDKVVVQATALGQTFRIGRGLLREAGSRTKHYQRKSH